MSPEVRATYRVQLHKGFTLDDAAAIVPYLARLGISHLYCSPYLQARSGSTHGYDVVDQSRVNAELGGQEAHDRLCATLAEHGMGHILDVVPNHMTVTDRANSWWWDVLKHGPDSRYAAYFDIDWDPPEQKLRRTILIPVLGDHYGRVLEAGDIRLESEGDELLVRYYEHVLPLAPGSLGEASTDEANGDVDLLHEVLERQHYRLAFWRAAGQELNYRRFFSINDLAALRMDNPNVFDDVHRLVVSFVREGKLDGLRIDHIDGLRDPEGYLVQLRSWAPEAYIVVEKILEPGEELRREWPVEGTTGYDFLNLVNGLFVNPAAEDDFTSIYEEVIGDPLDVEQLRHDNKMLLMKTELAADIERLTELFATVCEEHRSFRDYTRHEMRTVLREVIACFPVYRTYVSAAGGRKTETDIAYIREATGRAQGHLPHLEDNLLKFLADILLLEVKGEAAQELAMRFQQTTGPVMAKGVEDTTFYIYNRFVALNEVGGDPGRFGVSLDRFHDAMTSAQRNFPRAMLASSTHDTKRSEDVRARLALLSE
ncbi:MAG: malto-oligosyltrehalose synthase, partial [Actinomycetota bacterium]